MHKFAFVRLKTAAARDRILARLPEELAFLVPFVPKHKAAFRLSDSVLFFSAQSADFYRFGSRPIEFHSQNKTVAASMIAEKKVSGQRSYRVATRRQSFRRPNMISMRLRRL